MLSLYEGEKIIAGIILLYYGEKADYTFSSILPGYESYNIATYLVDKGIEWAIKKNCRYFSFGTSQLGNENLLLFKSRWGCRNIPVYYYYLAKKIKKSNLINSNTIINKLYSHLPVSFIRKIIPIIVPQFG